MAIALRWAIVLEASYYVLGVLLILFFCLSLSSVKEELENNGSHLALLLMLTVLTLSLSVVSFYFARKRTIRRRGLGMIFARYRQGLCLGCGYDLRGSAGACPECGTNLGRPRSKNRSGKEPG
ncbi:MAG: hypothetical protein NTW19_18590 [Planctomycetota bacterium]|nr:hypothetical protein [Planctomycetota bacterium]